MKKYILILALLTSTLHAQTLRETISTTIADGSGISASRLRTTLNYLSDSTSKKVDKISGKGLSTNDFNSTYKGALDVLDANLSLKGNTVYSKTALVGFAGTEARFDGSDWEKKSGNVASNGGSYAGTIINVSSSFYWERKFDYITPQMFGAKGDGVTDDITAFNLTRDFAKSKTTPVKIIIPQGKYKLNDTWILDGNSVSKALNVEGLGNVILDFSSNVSSICVQFGSDNTNTLSGGIKNIKIEGNASSDGLSIRSSAPYACAYNTFEDIHLYNVRDGLNYISGANTTSNFGNTFAGILKVERYFRIAVKSDGTYNNYNHLFLVQPSGETDYVTPNVALGNLTLALYDVGLNNQFSTLETEDQIILNGGLCKIKNLSMEHIVKGQGYAGGTVGLVINGTNVSIENLWMIEFNKNVISQMISVGGNNVSLKNIKYSNSSANSLYNLDYAIIPNNGSGVIENCDAFASYMSDHPAFVNQIGSWNFINVRGHFGFFSKFSNLTKMTANGLKLGDANDIETTSIFELQSTSKGVLLPRMTEAQRNAISSPAQWLQLICTDCTATDASTGVLQIYNGSVWKNAY